MNNIHKLLSEKTRTVCLLDGNSKNGDHCTRGPTYSSAGAIGTTAWQKVSSVDAIICVVTHSGSHSSYAPTSPLAVA